jgi:hypothetical protein
VVFIDPRLDNRIHRAGLLAEPAENALGQVDVVSRGAARAVLTLLGLDGDRQRRAYGIRRAESSRLRVTVMIIRLMIVSDDCHGPWPRTHWQ